MRVTRNCVVNGGLWRLLPVINVDRVKDIPCDYPGAMGVPITFMMKWNAKQFQVVAHAKPTTETGRVTYERIIIRNLHPECPEVIDIDLDFVKKHGYDVRIYEQVPEGEDWKLSKPSGGKSLTGGNFAGWQIAVSVYEGQRIGKKGGESVIRDEMESVKDVIARDKEILAVAGEVIKVLRKNAVKRKQIEEVFVAVHSVLDEDLV